MFRAQIANCLSLFRLFAAVPVAYGILNQHWLLVALLLLLAIISDVADGYLARRLQTSSAFGGLLDHSCDAIFVGCCLAAMACAGSISMLLPVLVVLSFLQYVLDSKALAGHALRSSMLGKNNGVAYYVLVVIQVLTQLLLPDLWPSLLIPVLAWLLITSTLLSMIDRLYALIKIQPSL